MAVQKFKPVIVYCSVGSFMPNLFDNGSKKILPDMTKKTSIETKKKKRKENRRKKVDPSLSIIYYHIYKHFPDLLVFKYSAIKCSTLIYLLFTLQLTSNCLQYLSIH